MNENSTNKLTQNLKSNIVAKLLIITALLQITVIILWFVPTMKISAISGTYYSSMAGTSDTTYSAVTDSYAMHDFFEGAFVFSLMFVALMLASLFFFIKPIIFSKLNKPNKFILSKISTIIILGIYFILFFTAKSDIAKYADIGAVCKLNFGGWLFIIFNIAIFILGIEASYKIKTNKILSADVSESNTEEQK